MSLIENVRVHVPNRSALSYDAALVNLGEGSMSFYRPSGIREYRTEQYDIRGAHIDLAFPCLVLFPDKLGKEYHHSFSSPKLGYIIALAGKPALEDGDGGQPVVRIDIASCLSKDALWINVSGEVASNGQPNPIGRFDISMKSPIADLVETMDFTLRGRINRI